MQTQSQHVERLVVRDQLDAILAAMPLTLGSGVFVALSFVVMMWGQVGADVLLSWAALVTLINLSRLGTMRLARAQGLVDTAPARVLNWSWIGALISGLCWAWALVACALDGQAYHVATGLAFCGINAGSVIQNSAHRATTLAFVLPNSLILLVIFLAAPSLQLKVVGIDLLLLTILMVRASTRAEQNFVTAARLRHEADYLAGSLQCANVATTEAMRRLEHAASHDSLTDLANRAAYQSAFESLLARAARQEGDLSVLLIDLDRFKAVNDTHGHAAGDAVLVAVAGRLRSILQTGDLAARLGGDEFAALLFRERMGEDDAAVAGRAVHRLGAPIDLPQGAVQVGASVGLARFPRDGRSLKELQSAADLALYAAKSGGRGTWCAFSEGLRDAEAARSALEQDLGRALEADTVEVWFQPQVEAATGRTCGLEALLRWNHPGRGFVPPPAVVEAAAAAGLSQALNRLVLRQACRMAALLEAAGRGDVVVAVNLSPEAFGERAVAALFAQELAAHGLSGSCLAVEITEQSAFAAGCGGAEVEALRAMGVGIVVDDFGMAYASLDGLRAFSFDSLKIDRTFVRGIGEGGRERALTEAILAFARALGVGVVAEGVETEAQAEILRALGCPVLQGYRYAPALPQAQALLWIARDVVAAAAPGPPAPPPAVSSLPPPARPCAATG